jgi:hypothetical protein
MVTTEIISCVMCTMTTCMDNISQNMKFCFYVYIVYGQNLNEMTSHFMILDTLGFYIPCLIKEFWDFVQGGGGGKLKVTTFNSVHFLKVVFLCS